MLPFLVATCLAGAPTPDGGAPSAPAAGKPATFTVSASGLGPLAADARVSVESLKALFPDYDVRAVPQKDRHWGEFLEVRDRTQVLFRVVPNDDGTISEVHILSSRIVEAPHGWRVGATVRSPDDLFGGCQCGALPPWSTQAVATPLQGTVGVSFGTCGTTPPRPGEPRDDGFDDRHFVCPVRGTIRHMVWRPAGWN